MDIENVYKKVLLVNKFEDRVIQYVKEGKITVPVYLSKGQEAVAAVLSELCVGWDIFAQHRSHDLYLCFGGDPKKLMDELLGLETGTSGGRAGSNCIHDLSINMWGHHGLIGENVPIATGFAFGSRKPTLCVFGDGAAEEDYIGPSFGFAKTYELPILYVCLDNNLSVTTPKEQRRVWDLVHMAEGYGLWAEHSYDLDVEELHKTIHTMIECENFPALLNVEVCRKHWHVGTGIDDTPDWDTLEYLKDFPYDIDYKRIENEVNELLQNI